ncbi:MAG: hypothetical protein OXG38_12935 [Chloroflexi bacterium]|nr:hypothetical protein [Chloroflexota bacterium]
MVDPKSQDYYWTPEWQAGEREALAEIAAGQTKEFENARDAIRWLLRAKDERSHPPSNARRTDQ